MANKIARTAWAVLARVRPSNRPDGILPNAAPEQPDGYDNLNRGASLFEKSRAAIVVMVVYCSTPDGADEWAFERDSGLECDPGLRSGTEFGVTGNFIAEIKKGT